MFRINHYTVVLPIAIFRGGGNGIKPLSDKDKGTKVDGKRTVSQANFFSIPFWMTLIDRKPVFGTNANRTDPVQVPHSSASDQGLHYFVTGISMNEK